MSTVRIQVRRGAAADWTSVNPTLAAGEVGFDTTSNKMKVGDGSTAWSSLAYISSDAPGVSEIAQDAIAQALSVGSGLSKTYDDNANTISLAIDTATVQTRVANVSDTEIGYLDGVTSSIQTQLNAKAASADITELAQDAVNTALVAGAGLDKSYDDVLNTITIDIDSTVVTLNGTQTLLNKTLNSPVISSPTGILKGDVGLENVDNTSDINKPVSTAQATAIGAVTTSIPNIAMDYVGDHTSGGDGITTSYNATTNSLVVSANVSAQNGVQSNTDNTGLITFSLEDNITISGDFTSDTVTTGSFSATDITATSLNLSGDLNVGGTTNTVNASTLSVEDPMIYMAADNATNAVDLGVVGSYTKDSVYQHTGLVRDASENTWKLFTGVVAEPTTTVNFTGAVYDNLLLGHIQATSANIGDVSNAELQHLNGVTSAVQTQIDAKLASTDAASTYAPKISPTLTGTVTLPSTTSIGTVSSTEIGYLDGVTSSVQNQLDLKAPADSPTFTGTVTLPANTISQSMMGDDSVGTNEIGGLAVTTAKIADLAITTAKLSDTSVTNAKLAGSIGWDKLSVSATVSDAELGYLDGVTSAVQTQIDAKASSSTVTSHTSATTNVHGIADTSVLATATTVATAKSEAITAAGSAADTKVSNAVAALTKSSVGLGNVDNTTDANKPVSTATQTALNLKADLSGPTFTGTVVLPSTTSIGNVSATEIGYVDGVTSAIQTQIDSKLALAGGTMTGALTLSGAPSADLHAATKAYVDGVTSNINFHQPVRVATTANITLSGTQTIDGVSLSVGDRVLVKDQTDQKTNGIYVVASSTWSRATDADNTPAGELAGGDFCLVLEGTAGAGYGYVCSNTSTVTVGSTNITYAPFNAAKAVIAGSGLTESTPGTIDIATGGVTSAMIADGTIVDGDINASAAIAQSKISGLTSDLAAKAPLASPTFTGTVTVASAGIAFTDGTQSKEGTPSRTPIVQKTAAYTLSALNERDSLIEVSSATAVVVTVPTNATVAYPVGTSIDILQTSTGQVSIAGAAGVTVNATPGLKLRTQWSGATLFKRATDTWVLYGDLSA